jgi:hypothetical protein
MFNEFSGNALMDRDPLRLARTARSRVLSPNRLSKNP